MSLVRFDVLTAFTVNNTILLNVMPYCLAEIYRRLGGTYFRHLQGRKTSRVSKQVSSEQSCRKQQAEIARKNVVYWDMALCRSCVNRRFGGRHSSYSPLWKPQILHRDPSICCLLVQLKFWPRRSQAVYSSETTMYHTVQRHNLEDGVHQTYLSFQSV
jgi:hypothetical protein